MSRYISSAGRVLVLRYPVPPRTAAAGELPAVRIELAPPASAAAEHTVFVVYEPYEEDQG